MEALGHTKNYTRTTKRLRGHNIIKNNTFKKKRVNNEKDLILKDFTIFWMGNCETLLDYGVREEFRNESVYKYYFSKSAYFYLPGIKGLHDYDYDYNISFPEEKTSDPIRGGGGLGVSTKGLSDIDKLLWFYNIFETLPYANRINSGDRGLWLISCIEWNQEYKVVDDTEGNKKITKLNLENLNEFRRFFLRNDTYALTESLLGSMPVRFLMASSYAETYTAVLRDNKNTKRVNFTEFSDSSFIFRDISLQEIVLCAVIFKVIVNSDLESLTKLFGTLNISMDAAEINTLHALTRKYTDLFSSKENIRTDLFHLTIGKDERNFIRILGAHPSLSVETDNIKEILVKLGAIRNYKLLLPIDHVGPYATREKFKEGGLLSIDHRNIYTAIECVDTTKITDVLKDETNKVTAITGEDERTFVISDIRQQIKRPVIYSTATNELHIISALLSEISYLTTESIRKLHLKNGFIYLGGFDEDEYWGGIKHKIHVWYKKDKSKYNLYICHRGSHTSRDWATDDYQILLGTAAHYDERVLKLPLRIKEIQNAFIDKLRDTIEVGESTTMNFKVDMFVTGHSLGGFLAMMTFYYSLGGLICHLEKERSWVVGEKKYMLRLNFNDGIIIPVVFNPFVGFSKQIINCLRILPPACTVYRINGDSFIDYASQNLWDRQTDLTNIQIVNFKPCEEIIYEAANNAIPPWDFSYNRSKAHQMHQFIGRAAVWISKLERYSTKVDFSKIKYMPHSLKQTGVGKYVVDKPKSDNKCWYAEYFYIGEDGRPSEPENVGEGVHRGGKRKDRLKRRLTKKLG